MALQSMAALPSLEGLKQLGSSELSKVRDDASNMFFDGKGRDKAMIHISCVRDGGLECAEGKRA